MTAVFLQILNISITASWLIAAVLLVRLLLKKAPKAATVALWGLVALRLVLPFSVESAFSLVPQTTAVTVTETSKTVVTTAQTSARVTTPTALSPTSAPVAVVTKPSAVTPATSSVTVPTAPQVTTPVTAATSVMPAPTQAATVMTTTASVAAVTQPLSWATVATVLWCVGMAAMLVYGVVSTLRLRHRVKASVRLRDNVYLCDDIESPFILGIIKPRIYLPSTLTEAEQETVLAHETAHLKRGDHIIKPFGFLLLTVYWFHPLVWVAYSLLCRDIEFACDERVFRTIDDNAKKEYLETLLRCSAPRRAVSACPLAFGETSVKERIRSALSYKKPTLWIMLVSLVAVVAVAVCFLTVRPAAKPKTPAPERPTVTTTAKPNAEIPSYMQWAKHDMDLSMYVFDELNAYHSAYQPLKLDGDMYIAVDDHMITLGESTYAVLTDFGWTHDVNIGGERLDDYGARFYNASHQTVGRYDFSAREDFTVAADEWRDDSVVTHVQLTMAEHFKMLEVTNTSALSTWIASLGDPQKIACEPRGEYAVLQYIVADANGSQWLVEVTVAVRGGEFEELLILPIKPNTAKRYTPVHGSIDVGARHIVAVRADGTVVAAGNNDYGQCNVEGWTDIIAVAAGDHHTVGLKSNGTVVAIGDNRFRQADISGSNMIAVDACDVYSAKLNANGRVSCTGGYSSNQIDPSDWTDITAIAAGEEHMVGLKADGTVVTTGRKNYGQWYVGDWTDIVAVAAGDHHTVGLKADGTVVATGSNAHGECDVADWTDIVAVAAGDHYTVGLRSDGTPIATGADGHYDYDRQEFLSWTEIVEIAVSEDFIVGLKADGTVVHCNGFEVRFINRFNSLTDEEKEEQGVTGELPDWIKTLNDTLSSWTDIRTTAFEFPQPKDIFEQLQAMAGEADDSSVYLVDNAEGVELCVRMPRFDDETTDVLAKAVRRKVEGQFKRVFDFQLTQTYQAPSSSDGMTLLGKIDYDIVYRTDDRMDIRFTGIVQSDTAAYPTNVYFVLNWSTAEKRLLAFEEFYTADGALYTAYRQAVEAAYAPRFSADELTEFMDELCKKDDFINRLKGGTYSWYTTENGVVIASPVIPLFGDVVTAEVVKGISLREAVLAQRNVFEDTYVEYVLRSGGNRLYRFSNRSHTFSVKLERFFTGTYLIPSSEPYAQDSKAYDWSVSGSDQSPISFQINAADQVRVGHDAVYTCQGIYAALEEWLVPLLQEQDRYGTVTRTSASGQFEYTVYDRNGEVMDTDTVTKEPHLFVYDSVLAHRWIQYGTGMLTRESYFYDLESGKRSPLYSGQTDHADELVCAALQDKVDIYDMFSGDVVQTIDTFEKPLADIAENIQCAYFTKDKTAVEIRYYTTDMTVVTETVELTV